MNSELGMLAIGRFIFSDQIFRLTSSYSCFHSRSHEMLCSVCHITPTQNGSCSHVFCQTGPPQRVNCLAPRWEMWH